MDFSLHLNTGVELIVVSISYIVQYQDISALEIPFILASRRFCPAVFEYRKEELCWISAGFC